MSFLNELKRRNVLRVAAAYAVGSWLLIQVAETIFPLFGYDDTPARIVVIVLAIGFFPALILAWVFEFTPGGLKRETEIDNSQPASRTGSKKLDRMIIVVLTLALALFAFDKFVMESQPGAGIETSIAVLPFSNRSAVADDMFFVDGIHDDILTQLANLSGLEKVISRTSMDRYRNTTKSIQQIGEELEVATILEGGVQRSGNRIRINMQLIDAANDKHLWAETYDREMTAENLFAIQSEIAREVVIALDAVLSEQDDTKLDRQPTTSLEAYGEFVLGRQEMAKRTVESLDKAKVHFEKAIELDPDYAMAYVGLASSTYLKANYSRPRQDVSTVSAQVQSLIDKALSLDPLSGEAWAALGLLRRAQGKNEEAEKYYLKAIELSPNHATAFHWYSNLLIDDKSRHDLALQYIQKAIELDPLADILKINLANVLRHLGRRDEMYEVLKLGHARNPDFVLYYVSISGALGVDGRIAEALRWSIEGVRRAPNHVNLRMRTCNLLANLQALELAEQCVLKLVEDFPDPGHNLLRDLYSIRGKYQEALAIALEYYPEEPQEFHQEMLAWAYLDAGQADKALEIAETIAPQFFEDSPVSVSPVEVFKAALATFALSDAGLMDRAETVGRATLETIKTMDQQREGYNLVDVAICIVLDDRPCALRTLREAIDSGWRIDLWQLRMPFADHMLEEPEWNAIIDELETDMSQQREWFLAHRDDPLE